MRTQAEKNRRTTKYKKNRLIVFSLNFQKYGEYKCECCSLAPLKRNEAGQSIMQPNTATVDHIIDLAHGGGNCLENLRVLCFECNNTKSNSKAG